MLDRTLMLCRHVYNAAIGSGAKPGRCAVSRITYYQQKAELPGIKEAMPEYAEVNAQVLQDVILRVDRAFQAFFRRVEAGKTPGYPRFHGRDRYNSFTYPQVGEHGGARWTMASWSCPRSGVSPCAGRRPLEGTPKTVTISREADGWYVCFSCADVPIQPLARDGTRDRHRPWDWRRSPPCRMGRASSHPGWYRQAERALKTAQRRVSRRKKGSNRRRKAVKLLAKAHQTVQPPAAGLSPQDGAGACSATTTRSITKTCRRPTWSRTTISPRASATPGGARS